MTIITTHYGVQNVTIYLPPSPIVSFLCYLSLYFFLILLSLLFYPYFSYPNFPSLDPFHILCYPYLHYSYFSSIITLSISPFCFIPPFNYLSFYYASVYFPSFCYPFSLVPSLLCLPAIITPLYYSCEMNQPSKHSALLVQRDSYKKQ